MKALEMNKPCFCQIMSSNEFVTEMRRSAYAHTIVIYWRPNTKIEKAHIVGWLRGRWRTQPAPRELCVANPVVPRASVGSSTRDGRNSSHGDAWRGQGDERFTMTTCYFRPCTVSMCGALSASLHLRLDIFMMGPM